MIDNNKCSEEFNRNVNKFSEADVSAVLNDAEKGKAKARKGYLAGMYADICDLFAMLAAYAKREYREVPWHTIAAIGVALAYLINPIDLVPDILPVIGLADDGIVITLCLQVVKKDLEKFREWRRKRLPPTISN
jgi:uncharacterized membrane protein YkvA (DUF1232 family)